MLDLDYSLVVGKVLKSVTVIAVVSKLSQILTVNEHAWKGSSPSFLLTS
jgi:hypothetical protein